MGEALKRTPLYAAHLSAGARMVPFGGWEMPVQYSGILEEHRAVRTRAGLFDVSHMGEVDLVGSGAPGLVNAWSRTMSLVSPGDRRCTLRCARPKAASSTTFSST